MKAQHYAERWVDIAAMDLPQYIYEVAAGQAGDNALETGQSVVLVGVRTQDETVVMCVDCRACGHRPGAVIIAPDTKMAEMIANGEERPEDAVLYLREDGRSALAMSRCDCGGEHDA